MKGLVKAPHPPQSELTYLLTYSMVQSPSWAANRFAASQEIPRISRNPEVHYRTHKHPPPVSILGQPTAVHIPTSHLLGIHPSIIHSSMSRSPQWSLSLRFRTNLIKSNVSCRVITQPHVQHCLITYNKKRQNTTQQNKHDPQDALSVSQDQHEGCHPVMFLRFYVISHQETSSPQVHRNCFSH